MIWILLLSFELMTIIKKLMACKILSLKDMFKFMYIVTSVLASPFLMTYITNFKAQVTFNHPNSALFFTYNLWLNFRMPTLLIKSPMNQESGLPTWVFQRRFNIFFQYLFITSLERYTSLHHILALSRN